MLNDSQVAVLVAAKASEAVHKGLGVDFVKPKWAPGYCLERLQDILDELRYIASFEGFPEAVDALTKGYSCQDWNPETKRFEDRS